MPDDGGIYVRVFDSRDEFRPGRSGGSVNWARLIAGVLLLVFGLVCALCPLEVLAGFVSFIAVLVVLAGIIGIVAYLRARNTLFEQGSWNLFFPVMLVLLGAALLAFPLAGVAVMAWPIGIGIALFGLVQLLAARRFLLVGAGMGAFVALSGVLEIIFGVVLCIWPGYLGVLMGLFAMVHAVDMIVFSLPIGRDRTNTLW